MLCHFLRDMTLLTALAKALENTYTVISLDFQGIGSAGFAAEETFVEEFCRLVLKEKRAGLVLPSHTEERFSKWADGSGKPPRLDDALCDREDGRPH